MGSGKSKSFAVILVLTVAFSTLTLSGNGVVFASQSSGISDTSFTPTLLWNYTTGGGVGSYWTSIGFQVYSPPVIANDTVYTGAGSSFDGLVYALNATNGTKLWSYGGNFPAFANGVLYVGDFENSYALNATNGSQLWNQSLGYGSGNNVDSSIVVENGVVYLSCYESGLFTLDAAHGYYQWRFVINNNDAIPVPSSPAVVAGVVYVSGGNTIYALKADNMIEIWNYTTGASFSAYGPYISSAVVDGGIVYFGSGDGNIYALNATNGSKLWNYTYAFPGFLVPSSATAVKDVLYIGSNNGNVYALNATSGAKLWSSATGGTVDSVFPLSTPAVVNGVVYIGSSDDNVYALNATTGARLWNYTIIGYTSWYGHVGAGSPVVVNGVLYVGGGNSVYALNISSVVLSSRVPVNVPTVIVVVAIIIIIVAVVFLMFRKRLKAKPTSLPTEEKT